MEIGDLDDNHPSSSAAGTSSSGIVARATLTPEASRLFRVYKTVASMLYKRGYLVPRDMREMTPASFAAKFGEFPSRESLTILVVGRMIVYICWENKFLLKPKTVYNIEIKPTSVSFRYPPIFFPTHTIGKSRR
jgi:hypothetical protein